MTQPAQPTGSRRRVGWWGRSNDYNWDEQGCLGCGLAWWAVLFFCFLIFGFWGWGLPGWGGWGGWGWRHGQANCVQTTPAAPNQGQTNVQPTAPSSNPSDHTGNNPGR